MKPWDTATVKWLESEEGERWSRGRHAHGGTYREVLVGLKYDDCKTDEWLFESIIWRV